jgi:phosphatidylglycerophosphate synthase
MLQSSPDIVRRMLCEEGELKLANLVTLSRALLIAPILALLLLEHATPALALYIVAVGTDAADGWLARRTARSSEFGAQLDALVDNGFALAILAFLALAQPQAAAERSVSLAVLFGAPLAYLALSYALYRRLWMFHFWSAKAGALLLFWLWPLLAVTGRDEWIPLAASVVAGSRFEQLVYLARGGSDLNAPHAWSATTRERVYR